MAAGTVVSSTSANDRVDSPVRPGDAPADWVVVCAEPELQDGAANNDTIVDPNNDIDRADQNWLDVSQFGSSVLVTLRYETIADISAAPVVQAFGRDSNDVPQRLFTAAGANEATLSPDAEFDVRDSGSGFSYTDPIEFLTAGCHEVIFAVKTKLAGTDLTQPKIMAKVR